MPAFDGGLRDGRTHGQTEFSSLDRVYIPCSAVITRLYLYPVAIETAGTWYYQATELVEVIGKRMNNVTGDQNRRRVCFGSFPWHFKGQMRFLFKHLRCQLVRCNALLSLLLNVCSELAWLCAGQALKIIMTTTTVICAYTWRSSDILMTSTSLRIVKSDSAKIQRFPTNVPRLEHNVRRIINRRITRSVK